MPVVIISASANVIADDPREGSAVSDQETLKMLHGSHSDDSCSEYLEESGLGSLGARGGKLRFVYCESTSSLRITTAYDVSRQLNEVETTQLVEFTRSQWSDGIGSGAFFNHEGDVLSTTLGMALQNAGHDDVGDLFVDPYPFDQDESVKVEFDEKRSENDLLLGDLKAAIEAGNPQAMTALGRRYHTGDGVEQDLALAYELFSKAGEAGDIVGLTFQALLLRRGGGVEKDVAKAIELFKVGVDNDYPLAMHCLGEVVAEESPEEAIQLYARGASLGHVGCLAELADCFEFGNGVEKDLEQALELYQGCLEMGFHPVEEAIARVKQSLGKQ